MGTWVLNGENLLGVLVEKWWQILGTSQLTAETADWVSRLGLGAMSSIVRDKLMVSLDDIFARTYLHSCEHRMKTFYSHFQQPSI